MSVPVAVKFAIVMPLVQKTWVVATVGVLGVGISVTATATLSLSQLSMVCAT